MSAKGSLVCVGCGIKGVSHLTLETVGWIRASDVVCYCCSDPATAIWIRDQAAASFDLASCYAEDRPRPEIYQQMVDIILSHVRAQKAVCVVFYGHPGVFVSPTHLAIAKARAEGFAAAMLPGISAADCLFADLGIDPSEVGCQMYEATDLLLRHRTIAPDSHLIVWQIGVVGNAGFRFGRYDNPHLARLVDRLSEHYGREHAVCHYQAAQFPMCVAHVEWVPLGRLAERCQTTGTSTLYLPPAVRRDTDVPLGESIGYLRRDAATQSVAVGGVGASDPPTRRDYVPPPDRSTLADVVNRMGVDPRLLAAFMAAPDRALAGEGLSEDETVALLSRDPARLRMAIKHTPPARPPAATRLPPHQPAPPGQS